MSIVFLLNCVYEPTELHTKEQLISYSVLHIPKICTNLYIKAHLLQTDKNNTFICTVRLHGRIS